MGSLLGLISIIGFLVSIVWLIVRLFKRSGRKKPLIGVGVCLVLFFIALSITPPTPPAISLEPNEVEIESSVDIQPKETPTVSKVVPITKPSVDKEKSKKDFSEIRAAYKANELAAEDKYKGKTYTLVGILNGITDSGLNKLAGTITATIEIKDGNTTCFVYGSFDKNYREALKNYSVGDEVIFKGECSSWGSWTNCELLKE